MEQLRYGAGEERRALLPLATKPGRSARQLMVDGWYVDGVGTWVEGRCSGGCLLCLRARDWTGFETTRRGRLATRTVSGRAAARGHIRAAIGDGL